MKLPVSSRSRFVYLATSFAGEVILATMAFLISFLIPLPFYFLEVAVGAIQAFVFMMLALIFFSMATVSHDHGDEHH